MISCQTCGRSFAKQITNTHLRTHSLTTADYRRLYGEESLCSADYRADKAGAVKGADNPNYGRRWDETKRKEMSAKKRGMSYNKGVPKTEDHKDKLRKAALIRNERWRESDAHPLSGRTHSEATKTKISVALTGRTVPPQVTARAVATRKAAGHQGPMLGKTHSDATKLKIAETSRQSWQSRRALLAIPYQTRIDQSHLTLLNDISETVLQLRCNVCGHSFTRTKQVFITSKWSPEVCDQCHPLRPFSKAEREIAEYVRQFAPGVVVNERSILNGLELDCWVPEHRVAIEYTGLYWHSDKHRFYHRWKRDSCAAQGIRLLTIFEDEWLLKRPIVESIIRNALGCNANRLNARDCRIIEPEPGAASDFLRRHHLLGVGKSNHKLALTYDDKIVQMMTFSNHELSRKHLGWEIARFCSADGITVRGGATKLYKHFIDTVRPQQVTTYADLRYGSGAVYPILGFTLVGATVPNYWYFKNGTVERKHRFSLRKQAHEPKEVSEWELRQKQGWNRIYDCGSNKYVWKNKGG